MILVKRVKEALKINRNKIHLQIGRIFIEACLLEENEIKEINKIKTREEYNKEINENKEEENTEELTNDNYFVHSEEEN